MLKKPIGRILRERRKELGWTLREAGVEAEIDHSHLHRIETGESIPTIATLAAIAGAYGLGAQEILKQAGIR